MRCSLQRLAAAAHGSMALREASSPRTGMACRIHLQVSRSGPRRQRQQPPRDARPPGWAAADGSGGAGRRRVAAALLHFAAFLPAVLRPHVLFYHSPGRHSIGQGPTGDHCRVPGEEEPQLAKIESGDADAWALVVPAACCAASQHVGQRAQPWRLSHTRLHATAVRLTAL